MGLRPEHGSLHAPDIDDVAHQEQGIHLDVVQKIQQQLRAAALEAQMDIRDEYGPQSRGRGAFTLRHASSP
jgi:hypothetical protein